MTEKTEEKKDELTKANTKIKELEKKLEEANFVLATANEKIAELEMSADLEAETNKIDELTVKKEYALIGNPKIKATVESIFPAGQQGIIKTSAKLLINGERCVLSKDLVVQMFYEVE